MKKLMLLAAIAISSGICTAQVSFGVQAGANFAMGKLKYEDAYFTGSVAHDQKNKMQVGFVGGFVAEIPIGSSLAFRPELNFMQQGTKETFSATGITYFFAAQQKVSLNYIQLPLNIIYKVPAGPGTVFFGLGPSLEIGLSGKNKFTSSTDPTENKNYTVKFDGKKQDDINNGAGDDNDHLKRFNIAADVVAGYKLGMGVFIKLAYDYGFLELSPEKKNPDPGSRASYKSSGFSVSVGYMISGGGKKKK